MLIDTHAHFDYPDYDPDRDEVLRRAREAGVTELISIGTRLETSQNAVRLASQYPGVWATVGIHPCDVMETQESDLEAIRNLLKSPRVVAIGEIGLDRHRMPGKDLPPAEAEKANQFWCETQERIFRNQLDLAVEFEFPVVLHQRDAWEPMLSILREYQGRIRGVFHCFGGTPEQAREVIELGHSVSFTGIVTFKNAKTVQETVTQVPESSFFVETDCPYLAPAPFRGKRCEPAHTRIVAEKIAELRGTSWEEIAATTTANARRFFRFQ